MALTPLGKVAAAIYSVTAPADTSFLWAKQIDFPANPNLVTFHYHNGTQWLPLTGSDFYRDPVLDNLNTPPGSPTNGDRYIVGAAPTGAWSGQANTIAEYNGSWTFYTPKSGDFAFNVAADCPFFFNSTEWKSQAGTDGASWDINKRDNTNGVKLKSNAGAIDIRNILDSDYANLQAKQITANGDIVISSGNLTVDVSQGVVWGTDRIYQAAAGQLIAEINSTAILDLQETVAEFTVPVIGIDPTLTQHLTTKSYVDGLLFGLNDFKQSARVASTANIDLATGGLLTIDGVVTVANDRVLVKNQSVTKDNGIYLSKVGTWTRTTDFDENDEVTGGAYLFVTEGTINKDTGWVVSTDDPIIVGTDPIVFTQFSAAGQLTFNNALTKVGLNVEWGGALVKNTTISGAFDIDFANTGDFIVNNSIRIPTLGDALEFGDGGTGFYEASTDNLYFKTNSTGRFSFTGSGIESVTSTRFKIANVTATATIPVFIHNRSSSTTGVGGVAGELSLIENSKEAYTISAIDHIFYKDDGATVLAQLERDTGDTYLNKGTNEEIKLGANGFIYPGGSSIRTMYIRNSGSNLLEISGSTTPQLRFTASSHPTSIRGGNSTIEFPVFARAGGFKTGMGFTFPSAGNYGIKLFTEIATVSTLTTLLDPTDTIFYEDDGSTAILTLDRDRTTGPGAFFNSTIEIPAGTVSNPSFVFSSSPTTGMYSSGANQFGIVTSGVLRWFWNSNGYFIGGAGTLLRLGVKANPDPSGTNGELYYNTTNNKFRAFENSAWVDLIGGGGVSFGASDEIPHTNTGTTDFDYTTNFRYTGSSFIVNNNIDTNFFIGRARIYSNPTDTAMFAHVDRAGDTNFAIRQDAAGTVTVNSWLDLVLTYRDVEAFKIDNQRRITVSPNNQAGQVIAFNMEADANAQTGTTTYDGFSVHVLNDTRTSTGEIRAFSVRDGGSYTYKVFEDGGIWTEGGLEFNSALTTEGTPATGEILTRTATGEVRKIVAPGASTGRFLKDDFTWAAVGGSGTVTSVAIAGTDGIDVDSGSPITTSGTITLGLSAIPNTSLANSTISGVSLGSTLAALTAGTGISAAGTYTGAAARTFAFDAAGLSVTTMVAGDWIVFDDAGTSSKALISAIPLSLFNDDLGHVENATHTGDVTGATALTIGANKVTLAMMAQVATDTFLGRVTAATGNVEVLTNAQAKTALDLTGTNSGDQTSIAGITGTKAQFDTAVTDGNFMYIGDAPTSHTLLSHTISGETTGHVLAADSATTYSIRQLLGSEISNTESWTSNAGTIGGSITDNQVAYGNGTDAIQGSANLLFDDTHLLLAAGSGLGINGATPTATRVLYVTLATNDSVKFQDLEYTKTGADDGRLNATLSTGSFTITGGTASGHPDIILYGRNHPTIPSAMLFGGTSGATIDVAPGNTTFSSAKAWTSATTLATAQGSDFNIIAGAGSDGVTDLLDGVGGSVHINSGAGANAGADGNIYLGSTRGNTIIAGGTAWVAGGQGVNPDEGIILGYDTASNIGYLSSEDSGATFTEMRYKALSHAFYLGTSSTLLSSISNNTDHIWYEDDGTTVLAQFERDTGNAIFSQSIINSNGVIRARNVFEFGTGSTDGTIRNLSTGGDINIQAGTASGELRFYTANVLEWTMDATGDLIGGGDNNFSVNATARTAIGQTNSPVILMKASAYDTSEHPVEWQVYVDPSADTGATSELVIQSRFDGGAWGTEFVLESDGDIRLASSSPKIRTAGGASSSGIHFVTNTVFHNFSVHTFRNSSATGNHLVLGTTDTIFYEDDGSTVLLQLERDRTAGSGVFIPQTPAAGTTEDVLVYGAGGEIKTVTQASLGGGFVDFSVGGDLGANQTMDSEDILDIPGGDGIETTVSKATTVVTLDVTLKLSELTDMTAGMLGADEFIVLDAGAQRRKAASEINLSIFNDDLGAGNIGGSATATYISYGTGSNTIGGEAAFTYTVATNTMLVDNIEINNVGAGTNPTISSNAVGLQLDLDSALIIQGIFTSRGDISINSVSATGNPAFFFYQDDTNVSLLQHIDTGDNFDMKSLYGGLRFYYGIAGTPTLGFSLANDGEMIFNSNIGGGAAATTFLNAEGNWLTPAGGAAATVTLANDVADTTTFIVFANDATGDQALKTNTSLTFNASTDLLTAGSYAGTWAGGTITVSKGGTGLTTIGTDYILTGNGTSAMTAESTFRYGVVANVLEVGYGISTATSAIQIGTARTGSGVTFIDFVAENVTYTDYAFRILRGSGANGTAQIIHRGTGQFTIETNEAADLSLHTTSLVRLHIHSGGDIGVGATTPVTATYKFELFGTDNKGRAVDWTSTSDIRLKTNVSAYGSVLDGLTKLNKSQYGLVTYNRWDIGDDNEILNTHSKEVELGLIAQDMSKVFPELVSGSQKERYDISYMRLAAVAAIGVAELRIEVKTELDAVKSETDALKDRVKELEDEVTKLKNYGNDND